VKIKDIEEDVLEEMLRYIYSGKMNDKLIDQLSDRLMKAAEEYDLQELKVMCSQHLRSTLIFNN